MTTMYTHVRSLSPTAITGWSFSAWLDRQVTAINAYITINRDLSELSEMDDHILSDIGLTRYEVTLLARGLR